MLGGLQIRSAPVEITQENGYISTQQVPAGGCLEICPYLHSG